jgi:hypothetical protein
MLIIAALVWGANVAYRHVAGALACLASVIFIKPAIAADWTTPEIAEESLFQAIHLVDLEQTLDIHHHNNLQEMGIDQGGCAWAIGHYPSEARIYAYMSAEAAVHLLVTDLLVRYGSPWMVHAFERTTMSINAAVVDNNARLGLSVKF